MSSNQTFKKPFPKELLLELLENICIKTDKYYIINHDAYKKGVFNDSIVGFLEKCKPFYHLSKQKYLERKLTYNSFTTIVRQICNFNKITYTSQIKYNKSDYNIVYYVYLNYL
jgi:hypothetical protein